MCFHRAPLFVLQTLSAQLRLAALVACFLAYLAFAPMSAGATPATPPNAAHPQEPCSNSASAADYWKPDGRAGDLEFDIPGGWKKVEQQGFVILTPKSAQVHQATRIGFLEPQTLNGSLHQYFAGIWNQWRQQFNMIDNGTPEMTRSPEGFEVLSAYTRIYSPSLGNGTFKLAIAHKGNRVQPFFFLDNTGDVDYDMAFDTFQHSVKFANAAKPELPEPGVPCGLSGLYTGLKTTAGMVGGSLYNSKFKIEILAFFPDGNVIRHLPEKGLENFNFGDEIKRSRDYCGRYRMIGNQVRITWSDDSTITGERDGKNLRIGGWIYAPAANSDGLKLNATYRTDWAPAGPRIRFSSDGRFIENGILDSIDYDTPVKSRGEGSYRITHYTVELHYSDGRYIPLSFYSFADEQQPERPKVIHLNSYAFVLAP